MKWHKDPYEKQPVWLMDFVSSRKYQGQAQKLAWIVLHPGRWTAGTWQYTQKEKEKNLNQTIIFRFYVNLQGCNTRLLTSWCFCPLWFLVDEIRNGSGIRILSTLNVLVVLLMEEIGQPPAMFFPTQQIDANRRINSLWTGARFLPQTVQWRLFQTS